MFFSCPFAFKCALVRFLSFLFFFILSDWIVFILRQRRRQTEQPQPLPYFPPSPLLLPCPLCVCPATSSAKLFKWRQSNIFCPRTTSRAAAIKATKTFRDFKTTMNGATHTHTLGGGSAMTSGSQTIAKMQPEFIILKLGYC